MASRFGRTAVAALGLLLLVGCTTSERSYAVEGTVRLLAAAPQGSAGAASAGGGAALHLPRTEPPEGDVIAGEVLVLYRADAALRANAPVSVAGALLQPVRALALSGARLYRAPGATVSETVALARALEGRPDVVAATPNRRLHTLATPDDPLYPQMWHLPAIGLPEAWAGGATGERVVVAVVDTGVRGRIGDDPVTHPDLRGALLPGYDFVGDDDDPFDDGTLATNGTHGTHVAATIGARAFDGVGIAGVAYGAGLLPVRVLGATGSGSLADVLDGVLWAAGEPVTGVPENRHPARIINVSLGGDGTCSSFEQRVYDRVSAAGALVVVAAGNGGRDARDTTPASCAGVVVIGATGPDGTRPWYSNYGPAITLMAPGGVPGTREEPGGVLSAVVDTGGFTWAFMQGTSMATPHVAGVAALLLGLRPELTTAELRSLLTTTARPLSDAACRGSSELPLTGDDCGAGLVDAAAAVAALRGGAADLLGTRVVLCPLDAPLCDLSSAPGARISEPVTSAPYRIDAPGSGPYAVLAWSDRNGNGLLDAGDLFGMFEAGGEPLSVRAPATSIEVALELVVEPLALPFTITPR
jgi:serine protease